MSRYANTFAGRKITNKFVASGHAAIDFAAREGDPTPSPVAGTVVAKGSGSNSSFGALGYDYGKWIVIGDAAGREHFFAHLSNNDIVSLGQTVTVGQDIGKVGHTGGATGPHTHWGVFGAFPTRSTRVDPITYINTMIASELVAQQPVGRSDANTVRAVSQWLQRQLPGYSSAASSTGIRGYYYWCMVQRYGKNKGIYTGPVNGIPGANSRRVEAYIAGLV